MHVFCDPRSQHHGTRLLVLLAFKQRVLEDVTQCEHALELVLFIDYDETVHAAPANRVVNGGELVLHRARVYAGEILHRTAGVSIAKQSGWGKFRDLTSERLSSASPTVRFRSS